MKDFIPKINLGILAVGFTTLSIQLFPLSKQALSWNRCLGNTSYTLGQIEAVKKINDDSREVLAVMICNGAVFEPKFTSKMQ